MMRARLTFLLATLVFCFCDNEPPEETAALGSRVELAAGDVWLKSDNLGYLQNIRCYYCTTHPHYRWKKIITVNELYKRLRSILPTPVL